MKLLFVFCVLLACVTSIHGCKIVSCSSKNYKYRRCVVPGLKSIQTITVSEQYSRSGCALGYSFGATKNAVWVHKGCRAKFGVCQTVSGRCPNYRVVKCSSLKFKYATCLVSGSSAVLNAWVHIKHSKSSCVHGKSFGSTGVSLWVDKGCRATFHVCYLR